MFPETDSSYSWHFNKLWHEVKLGRKRVLHVQCQRLLAPLNNSHTKLLRWVAKDWNNQESNSDKPLLPDQICSLTFSLHFRTDSKRGLCITTDFDSASSVKLMRNLQRSPRWSSSKQVRKCEKSVEILVHPLLLFLDLQLIETNTNHLSSDDK